MIRRGIEMAVAGGAIYIAYKALRKDTIKQIKDKYSDDHPKELQFIPDEMDLSGHPKEMSVND